MTSFVETKLLLRATNHFWHPETLFRDRRNLPYLTPNLMGMPGTGTLRWNPVCSDTGVQALDSRLIPGLDITRGIIK
jgi:hypothetical protein